MAIHTDIEFAHSTLNIAVGCMGCELWHPDQGIKKCYAGNLVKLYGGHGKKGWPAAFEHPQLFPDRIKHLSAWPDLTGKPCLSKPWLDGYPRVIFLNDLGDTFTKGLPDDWFADYLEPLANCKHIIMIVTKNSQRMRDFFSRHKVPKNFWLTVTVTSAATYNRVANLAEIDHDGVKAISYEPAMAPIDLDKIPGIASVNWVLCGGESAASPKEATPFDITWARTVQRQCESSGKRYFFKQMGSAPMQRLYHSSDDNAWAPDFEWPLGTHFGNRTGKPEFNGRQALLKDVKFGGSPEEWPIDMRVRQMPMPERYCSLADNGSNLSLFGRLA